ncbi:hypothetical protein MPER_09193 [Moniliophthora perniciosa FA553]|nr:hypothetical protein MPER_09193 [Moniliophthora perniciosa FA553]
MFDNLAISFWLLNDETHTGTESEIKRVLLLTKEEAKAVNAQFSVFFYRQDHPLLRPDLDVNVLWYTHMEGRHAVYGPLVVFKHHHMTNLPIDLGAADASYVASILEQFFNCLLADDSESNSSVGSTAVGTRE